MLLNDELLLVPGDGPEPCRWLFIGEAGEELWAFAARAGLTREQVYVDNVYPWYRQGNPKPTPAEIRAAQPRLHDLLIRIQPRVVILLGATAIEALLPGTTLKASHGLPVQRDSTLLVPLYHPSAVLHNPTLRDTMN